MTARLDKIIADIRPESRKDIRLMIKNGRITVDGKKCLPDEHIDPEISHIEIDGEAIRWKRFHYYMMNKPTGVLTAARDKKQKTIMDLLPAEMRNMSLSPVGRLDKDTSGLLILTDDGDFTHKVISPKHEVWKRYYAEVIGNLDERDSDAFEKGIQLGDGTQCLPAHLSILSENSCYVMVMEGKYHQVRRMLASRGTEVVVLKRISEGSLNLDTNLREGEFRELTEAEVRLVLEQIS